MKLLPKRTFFIALLLGVIFGVWTTAYRGDFRGDKAPLEKNIAAISFKNVSVEAEVVNREDTRILGLSGRSALSEGEGMWFDFISEGYHGFWMKDMNFPIDILWFDKHLRIIHMKENASPESYPETYAPPSPDRFVLEVPAGFVKKYAVSLGESVTVNKTP
ncbi:MAG: DUF192 domain-containing protein [Candidatus Paceibacterota bacterium]|jgi:hypothetical protein